MATELTVNNVLWHLNAGADIAPLLQQDPKLQAVGPKRSSMDCKRLVVTSHSPRVAVYASDGVEEIATKFGFHSFLQLLKPFGDRIEHKFQIKDSQLVSRTAEDFALRFCAPLSDIFSVQEAVNANKTQLFSAQSLEMLMGEYIQALDTQLKKAQGEGKKELSALLKESIYTKFFTKMLSSSTITPFEPMNHPVSSFIFVSAHETYDQARQQLIQFKSSKVPDYLNLDDVLPVFIVVHDITSEEEEQKAFQLREHIKKQLNVETFVLPLTLDTESHPTILSPPIFSSVDEELQNAHLSSTSPSVPLSNVTHIYKLIKEIIQKKIIPYMEMKIATWDEQVIAPRKSITGRFFNVGKKYFGSNKAHTQSEHTSNYNAERGSYGKNANEAITRKLADWAFMLRDYKYAYTSYEYSKKDFLGDKAWSYLASAQEMAAISLLMGAITITSKLKNDTIDPLLDSSNYGYMARCGLKTYALRSILVVGELFCTLRDSWTNSPSAAKWMSKAMDDKLVGRIGKSLLFERIGYIYSLMVFSQAKIIMTRKLIKDKPEETPDVFVNPNKFNKTNTATVGFTRSRKAALYQILAAKNWDPVSHPVQVQLCIESTANIYKGLSFAERDGSLYTRLQQTASKSLSAGSS